MTIISPLVFHLPLKEWPVVRCMQVLGCPEILAERDDMLLTTSCCFCASNLEFKKG